MYLEEIVEMKLKLEKKTTAEENEERVMAVLKANPCGPHCWHPQCIPALNRTQIAEVTGMPRSTVYDTLRRLERKNKIEKRAFRSGKGRKPVYYREFQREC